MPENMKIENGSIGKKCCLIEERNLIGNAKNCISITQTNVVEYTFAIVKINKHRMVKASRF